MNTSSLNLLCAIIAFIGGTCFLASVPSTAKSLRRQIRGGKVTLAEARKQLRTMKVLGLGQIVVAAGFLLGQALHLHE